MQKNFPRVNRIAETETPRANRSTVKNFPTANRTAETEMPRVNRLTLVRAEFPSQLFLQALTMRYFIQGMHNLMNMV